VEHRIKLLLHLQYSSIYFLGLHVVYFKDCVGLVLLVIFWLFFSKTVLLMQCFKFQFHNPVPIELALLDPDSEPVGMKLTKMWIILHFPYSCIQFFYGMKK
jgi:hypothetical protein